MSDYVSRRYLHQFVVFESNGRPCSGTVTSARGPADDPEITVESDDYQRGAVVSISMLASNTRQFGPCTPRRDAGVTVRGSKEVPTHWGW